MTDEDYRQSILRRLDVLEEQARTFSDEIRDILVEQAKDDEVTKSVQMKVDRIETYLLRAIMAAALIKVGLLAAEGGIVP